VSCFLTGSAVLDNAFVVERLVLIFALVLPARIRVREFFRWAEPITSSNWWLVGSRYAPNTAACYWTNSNMA